MLHAPLSGQVDPDLVQSIEDFLPVAAMIRAQSDLLARMPAGQARAAAREQVQSAMDDLRMRADRHGLTDRQFLVLLYREMTARRTTEPAEVASLSVVSSELAAAYIRESEARRILTRAQTDYLAARAAREAAERREAQVAR
ncbi:MAG: hypothetical protein QHC65_06560 [Sphingomonas sp.]|nr:hypothetical protein [Sphingomonas sp.]MDX3884065.1 hypothetical protein [Sphingomonas sp.]